MTSTEFPSFCTIVFLQRAISRSPVVCIECADKMTFKALSLITCFSGMEWCFGDGLEWEGALVIWVATGAIPLTSLPPPEM